MGHFCPPGSGSGSSNSIESGSNPDPNPQHWLEVSCFIKVRGLGNLCVLRNILHFRPTDSAVCAENIPDEGKSLIFLLVLQILSREFIYQKDK